MKCFVFILSFLLCIKATSQNFTEAEIKIITGGDTTARLRVIPITEPEGYAALRATSKDIVFNDPLLPLLKERMYKAVQDPANKGVGIAAPQVGINRNLIWVQRFDKESAPFEFYINPKIVWHSQLLRKGMEGDLSFKDKRGDVVRSYTIMFSYTDVQGRQHIEMVEDFTAVIIQHETDHLFGTLLTDRLEEQKNKTYKIYTSPRKSELLLEEQ